MKTTRSPMVAARSAIRSSWWTARSSRVAGALGPLHAPSAANSPA